jgi:hypothetical protein
VKHSQSLEQERQALLAQIQSSRAVYRRLLTEADAPEQDAGAGRASAMGNTLTDGAGSAIQWVKQHPALAAAGMAGAIAALLLARRRARRRAKSLARVRQQAPAQTRGGQLLEEQSAVPRVARGVLVSTLAGLAQGMLRNPARMRYIARSMAVAMRYIRRWRNNAAARGAQVRHEAKKLGASAGGAVRDGSHGY